MWDQVKTALALVSGLMVQDASAPRGVKESQTAPRDFLGTSEAAALERSCGQKLQQAPMYNKM